MVAPENPKSAMHPSITSGATDSHGDMTDPADLSAGNVEDLTVIELLRELAYSMRELRAALHQIGINPMDKDR